MWLVFFVCCDLSIPCASHSKNSHKNHTPETAPTSVLFGLFSFCNLKVYLLILSDYIPCKSSNIFIIDATTAKTSEVALEINAIETAISNVEPLKRIYVN